MAAHLLNRKQRDLQHHSQFNSTFSHSFNNGRNIPDMSCYSVNKMYMPTVGNIPQ